MYVQVESSEELEGLADHENTEFDGASASNFQVQAARILRTAQRQQQEQVQQQVPQEQDDTVSEDELRMINTCIHPKKT